MAPARWQLITDIFHRAVAFGDAAEREAYLEGACHSDPSLRSEIDSLLEAHADTSSVIDRPLPRDARVGNRLAPGTTLGPYQVERLLGAGGMGDVYRARDTRLGRPVALKMLPMHLRTKPQLLARFEREARAIAGFNHPYICTLYDVGRHEDIDFLVMELIEGETLAERLRNGRLPIDEAVRLAHEIAEALAAAHAKGIIHRDIKPSNIFVTKGGHVKVIDFGLAKESSLFHSSESTQEDRTQPGVTIGTLLYMSPEQALGQPLDPRTDLFSLGVVLFECLTGELPFVGQSRIEYLPNLLAGRLKSVAALRPEVPPQLQAILARCLEHDTAKRLDSASWLAAELERISPRHADFRPWFWGTGAALVAGIAVLVIVSRPPPPPPPTGGPVVQTRWFTTSPGEETDSHLSPDGMWMSYIAIEQGEPHLYVQQVDGGKAVRVALPAGEIRSHVWSPTSSAYACLIWRDPDWMIQTVPTLFGGDVQDTVKLPKIPRSARLLRWIGRTIYLQVAESGRSWSLQRVELDTETIDRVAGPWNDMRVRGGFDVKPDGRQVVWSAAPSESQQDDLFLADFPGGRPTRLTPPEDGSRKRFPLWNGRGTGVIYQSTRGGQQDLWELDIQSRVSAQLSFDPGSDRPDSTATNGSLSYQVTTQRTTLSIWGEGQSGFQFRNEGLSDLAPNASRGSRLRVAFQRTKPLAVEGFVQLDTDIFIADAAEPGSSPQRATKVATGHAPRLSPDGQYLAYLQRSQKSTSAVLIVMKLDTLERRTASSMMVIPSSTTFPLDWTEQSVAWTSLGDLYYVERAAKPNVPQLVHYRFGSQPAPVPATVSAGRLTDIYPSSDGKQIAYLMQMSEKDRSSFQLHVLDVVTGTSRVVKDLGSHSLVQLRGWIRNDSELVVARSLVPEPQAWTFELMSISLTGVVRDRQTVNHVTSISQVAPRASELYFTRSEAGIGNLFAYSFATRNVRQVSDNAVPDVTFGAATPLGADHVVGIRHELTKDIYLRDARPQTKPPGGDR